MTRKPASATRRRTVSAPTPSPSMVSTLSASAVSPDQRRMPGAPFRSGVTAATQLPQFRFVLYLCTVMLRSFPGGDDFGPVQRLQDRAAGRRAVAVAGGDEAAQGVPHV